MLNCDDSFESLSEADVGEFLELGGVRLWAGGHSLEDDDDEETGCLFEEGGDE